MLAGKFFWEFPILARKYKNTRRFYSQCVKIKAFIKGSLFFPFWFKSYRKSNRIARERILIKLHYLVMITLVHYGDDYLVHYQHSKNHKWISLLKILFFMPRIIYRILIYIFCDANLNGILWVYYEPVYKNVFRKTVLGESKINP